MDKAIRRFHLCEAAEWMAMRRQFRTGELMWPKVKSHALWFSGLEKYGIDWATREYELREERPFL